MSNRLAMISWCSDPDFRCERVSLRPIDDAAIEYGLNSERRSVLRRITIAYIAMSMKEQMQSSNDIHTQ